jgi:transketolase
VVGWELSIRETWSVDRTDEICINTLRFLAVDAVERAGSGHPGLPLGAAPAAYVLWDRFLRHNPVNPGWFNRDRFILSAGHGSALLYALLHMTGYDLPLEELMRFRQWGSKTPGHPEYRLTPGVEATTGPLGQGFAMGVGMAIAERYLSEHYNRPGLPIIDHYTYAIVSDGDLMEGVSHEAASLAGHLGLGKLVYIYDDNGVSIEGSTDLTFTENVPARFRAYDWHVESVADANDVEALAGAIRLAREDKAHPSLVVVRSHIGYGSPKQDTAAAHGEPLGPEAARATKQALGWPLEPEFYVPAEALAHCRRAVGRGRRMEEAWQADLQDYRAKFTELAAGLEAAIRGELPPGWDSEMPVFDPRSGPIATRSASGEILNAMATRLPGLIGGSADLAPSNKTMLGGFDDFGTPGGRNLHFGVREFATCAAVNGMALHGGLLPYGATFLIFSDYMRPAIRLAALMKAHSMLVFTHDSIALGQDGPTHQPVEQLMSLRMIPGLTVLRPADANEAAACWKIAVEAEGPVALLLTRQKLPVLDLSAFGDGEGPARGGYILRDTAGGPPGVAIIATGSEVHLALHAAGILKEQEIRTRVVSLPSWDVFDSQPLEYRNQVLPPGIPKLAVEAGVSLGWERYTGNPEAVLGLDRFGASAPGDVVYANLGFTAENVVAMATRIARR